MKLKIKKGATVEVIAGADKGKKGTVTALDKKNLKIQISGVKLLTHFDRKEGLNKKEGFINYSNVVLVSNPDKKAPTKRKAAKTAKA